MRHWKLYRACGLFFCVLFAMVMLDTWQLAALIGFGFAFGVQAGVDAFEWAREEGEREADRP